MFSLRKTSRQIKKFIDEKGLPTVIFSDFDGCLTDDRVFLDCHGHEFVAANRKDGLAIGILKAIGIEIVIVSKEKNTVVTARATKLNVPVFQGVEDKVTVVKTYVQNLERQGKNVSFWYVGNDRNDIDVLRIADLPLCPIDALPRVKKICSVILKTKGGYGIFSEILTAIEDSTYQFGDV